jgi:hypothetical protein
MNLPLIVAFVVFDLVVTATVLVVLVRRRAAPGGAANVVSGVQAALAAVQPEVDSAFKANWSGETAALPGLLEPLLSRLEDEMRSRQLPADRAQLKLALAATVAARRLASRRDVDEALRQVA